MSNVLEIEKQHQIRALGALGRSLRAIEAATGVRRETISVYLKAAGNGRRQPRRRCPIPILSMSSNRRSIGRRWSTGIPVSTQRRIWKCWKRLANSRSPQHWRPLDASGQHTIVVHPWRLTQQRFDEVTRTVGQSGLTLEGCFNGPFGLACVFRV